MNMNTELDKILTEESITTLYQPIVSLGDGEIIGYEALSRGPSESPLYYPDKLFETARVFNRLWELDALCRIKAIERSRNIGRDKLIFINVDSLILKDEKFRRGFTKDFLDSHNISPECIIFEITERTAIDDYTNFRNVLRNYTDQGYKIAIDDTGSGYSGLKTISETKPHYLKIDIDLIRNIDVDSFKQALIKTFVTLSHTTGMKLIAEGVETENELITLIKLGVYAAQGFFLQKPSEKFEDINLNIKEIIQEHNTISIINCNYFHNYIGQVAMKQPAFSLNASCDDIKEYFTTTSINGACIVNGNEPVGLMMEHKLDSVLATKYGVAVFSKRPISLVMDTNALIVDFFTPVSTVSKAAMARKNDRLYDYVIVTKNSKYYGIATVKTLLEFTTELERNYAKELNPLTGMPGNIIIESNLRNLLSYSNGFCVLYLDLNNFKVYNDIYGFENGDRIIKFTANLIRDHVNKLFPFNVNAFVGHIGGDDFICILQGSPDKYINICKNIINDFDKNVLDFFNETDRYNGYIESYDRKGNKDIFPLTSISIAGLTGNFNKYNSPDEIAQIAGKVKKKAKMAKHSDYVIEEL
ncbi:MAG: GGDEF domain-containing protein [Bacillota bacterium]|nr:GGDEF domain-containing protein [Bacillota bacterium]